MTAPGEQRETEEMAIISDVRFGVDDRDRVSLRFEVHTLHGSAGQGLYGDDIGKVIKDSKVSDVHQLNGRACVVKRKGYEWIHFKEMFR